MSRQKKDGIYLNIKLERDLYNRLIQISEEAGQTKTIIVERALSLYFDEYEEKQTILSKYRKNTSESTL